MRGVRLGEWNLRSNPDCDESLRGERVCAPPVIDLAITQKFVHSDFIPFSVHQNNDIAILRLNMSVEFNSFVRPICLPSLATLMEDLNGISMVVSGFGRTENNDTSKKKLKAEVWGISNVACQNIYLVEKLMISPTQMCALGENGKDSW